MAGTNRAQAPLTGGPCVVLVNPQLADNIGAVARAMLNFGLLELRLVAPRDGWPQDAAFAMASGADAVLHEAKLYETIEEATADLGVLYATSARPRDMEKPVLDAAGAAEHLSASLAAGHRAGLVMGPERAGLTNDEISLCDHVVVIRANPAFASINLAQAVLILGYEWFKLRAPEMPRPARVKKTRPANKAELFGLFSHLEAELDRTGFLFPPDKRPAMVRNLRNMLSRANFTEQNVRTLRGVIKALAHGPLGGKAPADD
jgi:tRNA/rRNA methyltransferase